MAHLGFQTVKYKCNISFVCHNRAARLQEIDYLYGQFMGDACFTSKGSTNGFNNWMHDVYSLVLSLNHDKKKNNQEG